ncbi:E3 ubiquitin-protein ligase RNF144A isoform X2 [Cimex lectularius]|uniref:E3 ubiquitin-protein ligase RNF144B n=1 Tax=Cimex lectularius TaxID=79782 RepID=A0A8I6SGF0_CIMLE|nr:E3 ubiquitin-protein ligase RNF144A isoform X2 [Cimex lectularius]
MVKDDGRVLEIAMIGCEDEGKGKRSWRGDEPRERASHVKSWYGYGAFAEDDDGSQRTLLSSKERLKWRSSLALGSILSKWSRSRMDVGSSGGSSDALRKVHTVLALSEEPMRPVNRLRHHNIMCSRCSSLLSMASSSRYSITTDGNYVQVGRSSSPVPPSPTILCKVCLSTIPESSMWTLQCSCIFCIECMRAYVEFEISQGAYEISCPDAMCKAQGVVSLSEIENLVNSDVMEKYRRYRLNREVEDDIRLAWCPSAGCETVCQLTQPSSAHRVHCPSCATDFCSLCRGPWHPSGPCPQAGPAPGIPFDSDLIKCCPMCAVPIEKDEGCAQMMCKRCKHVFCWYCLASLDDDFLLRHYDKGPCKNKLGHSRASVIWHRTQVIGIFAGFGILLLVASPLLLLAAPCIVCCKCRVCTGGPRLDPEDDLPEESAS